jgi:hypothetical protein
MNERDDETMEVAQGKFCSVCGRQQFSCFSGLTCGEHGGADSIDERDALFSAVS